MADASVLSEAPIRDGVRAVTMRGRAFDKTVSRKPLALAVDAVYGNSIDLGLEVIARKGLARKAWLLMLINVLLPAFAGNATPRMFSFKRRDSCTYTRDSVRRASGFVLTGKSELETRDLKYHDQSIQAVPIICVCAP